MGLMRKEDGLGRRRVRTRPAQSSAKTGGARYSTSACPAKNTGAEQVLLEGNPGGTDLGPRKGRGGGPRTATRLPTSGTRVSNDELGRVKMAVLHQMILAGGGVIACGL